MRNVEVGVEFGTARALNAMVGPEYLRAVGGFDGVGEWLLAGVRGGEGDVAAGMPVLGENDVVEAGGEGGDAGDDGVAVLDRQ